jgi:hypothetical protein
MQTFSVVLKALKSVAKEPHVLVQKPGFVLGDVVDFAHGTSTTIHHLDLDFLGPEPSKSKGGQ